MPAADRDQAVDSLSVRDMLRIMDVATTLRQDRELVEEQLNLDALKQRLRERMIAAAEVTGEEVTPAEVDAAIDVYYRQLNTYQEPPLGPAVALAHLYVRRVRLARWAVFGGGSLVLVWWLFLSPGGRFTNANRAHRQAERVADEVARKGESALAVAQDPEAVERLTALRAEAQAYRKQDDVAKLRDVEARTADLEARLRDEYAVSVRGGQGPRTSAIDRTFTDKTGRRVTAYYLLVQAKRPDGSVVTMRIHDVEKDRDADVKIWAERVPKDVYDRLLRDKKEDGVLNETAFSVKRRGELHEQVTMPGADGKPLEKLGQLTEW